jgi:hypothetical protein
MGDRLIGYTTGADQRPEIERAAGDWRVVGWSSEPESAPPQTAARSGLRAATLQVVRGEAEGVVVRSLADVSEEPAHHGVVDWFLRLGARFVALADGLDTREPAGRERATEIVRAAGAALRAWAPPSWEERNEIVARHIAPGSSVLDLGAGTEPLRRMIQTDRYQAADRVTWRLRPDGSAPLWWDPDLGIWPSFGERFDVAVLSGVAEYLADVDGVLARLRAVADRLVLTYCAAMPGRLPYDEIHALLDRHASSWSQVAVWRAHRIFTAELRE